MATTYQNEVEVDGDSDEEDVAEHLPPEETAAVVSGTDWTAETIVSQLKRGNIHLTPRFQRRDAWKPDRKSRFIESLIVGLPIPQIVLAEDKNARGKFIVLDGKQRLLTIMQFWGVSQGPNNAYALSGLTLREDLAGSTFVDLSADSARSADFNALCNQSIRTVVIRNWKDSNFLHTVFLRLNTGSVNLSPQELRQALLPGQFSDHVDEAAAQSKGLRTLLGLNHPDPRMRDIEILARFLSFRFFAKSYPGRMKSFLDDSFDSFNKGWDHYQLEVAAAEADFEAGVTELARLFGKNIARKPESPQFNRAIFDALIYFHSQKKVRTLLTGKDARLKKAYQTLFDADSGFLKAIESDTAGAPNTQARLELWASRLSAVTGSTINPPVIPLSSTASGHKVAATPVRRKRSAKR